jgi:predicted nucleic acid-binding Zn ribbon protein
MDNHWLYITPPWDEPQHKCIECEKPIYEEGYCSNKCLYLD